MSEIDPALLKRYSEGLCNQAEKDLVQRWLESEEPDTDDELFYGIDKECLQKEIWQEVEPPLPLKEIKTSLPAYFYRAVACILLLAFGYLIFYSNQNKSNVQQSPAAIAIIYKEIKIPLGRTAHVKLADGTEVNLNAGTKFKYPISFAPDNPRTVYLEGEAYFKVAKDLANPFIVLTDRTSIKVLGTAFNINAYAEEQNTTVTVEEGKVQFASKENPHNYLLLAADQQGIMDNSQNSLQKQISASSYLNWKDDKLFFNNLKLEEIATILYRKYNVQITIEGKRLKDECFSGSYHRSSLRSIAGDISQALHCQYKLSGESLVFY